MLSPVTVSRNLFSRPPRPLMASLRSFPFPRTIARRPSILTENPSSCSSKFSRTTRPTPSLTTWPCGISMPQVPPRNLAKIIAWKLTSSRASSCGLLPKVDVFGTDYPTPDGTCVRDYIHVLDIADFHVRALEEIDRVSGEAFNVGNSRGFSILEVMDAAEHITGRKIPRKLGAQATRPFWLPAKEKLKRGLGWEASHSSMEEIIGSAWAWRQKHPHGYSESVSARS